MLSLLIGTYTEKLPHVDGHARGILSAVVSGAPAQAGAAQTDSAEAGSAEASLVGGISLAGVARNPSWLAVSRDDAFVYAVVEATDFSGGAGGGVAAFARDAETNSLTPINSVPSGGDEPAYLSMHPSGRFLAVANYGGGSVTILSVRDDGGLGEASDQVQLQGSGPDPVRQAAPHAHQAVFDPVTGELLVVDLGSDAINVYEFGDDGRLSERIDARLRVESGGGPRHLAFRPGGNQLVVICELDNSIVSFRRVGARFVRTGRVSTLPTEFEGASAASAVRFSTSGRYVFAANRGHNSVALFEFDDDTETLRRLQVEASGGSTPRDLVQTPDGRHVLVANQDSDWIATLRLDEEEGTLTNLGGVPAPSPVCLVIL